MKMKQEHYDYIKKHFLPFAEPHKADKLTMIQAHRQFIINEGKAKDIEKRLRWDILYYVGMSTWISANLYDYLNDDHIDTALRQIMRELQA